LVKPVDHTALVARVRAMLRLKVLYEQIAELNATLERRVSRQVEEIQRISRLKRFLAPQVAAAVLASEDGESALESHRRDVAVLFCDIRDFTAFAETSTPDELMALLAEYHEIVGSLAFARGGTLERFTGDAVMVFFNDPVEVPDYHKRAVELAIDLVAGTQTLFAKRRNGGTELGIGIGVASGSAILGQIGYSERLDYAAIGMVTNLASRLTGLATRSQILANADVAAHAHAIAEVRSLGLRDIKGFAGAVEVFELGPKSLR
jgi:class 3 adenylate cyclase